MAKGRERDREGNPLHISNFLKDLCGKMGIGDVLRAGNFGSMVVSELN